MKSRIITLFVTVFIFLSLGVKAETVTVGATGTYSSIAQAIAGVGTITEPLIIEITADYAQTTDVISSIAGANASNYVTIRPQAALTVAGNDTIAGYVWKMDGCQYVTIDGRVDGVGNPVLTLRADTCVGNPFGTLLHLRKTSALYVTNSNNIKIQYVNFRGATNENYRGSGTTIAPTMGTVTLASGTKNLIMNYCDLGPIDAVKGTPTVALVSLGTAESPNSDIVISNNNIYDYFPADMNKNVTYPSTGVGVLIYDFNTNCTISGNSFYKTYAHSATGFTNNSNARTCGIAVVNTSGSGFIIKDNYIGGSEPLCGGVEYTADIRNNTSFNGIYMSVGTSGVNAVYGNTIKNLMILAHSAVANTAQCSGIFINGGKVNVGIMEDEISPSANIIGDMSSSKVGANASIKFCATNNNAAFSAIIYNSLVGGNVKINNNKIGGVTVNLFKDYTTIRTASFVGINILGTVASSMLIDNNQIGNNETGIVPTSMSIQNFMSRSNYGVNVNPAVVATATLAITNNKINNIYHAQQTTTQTYNHGIFINTSVLCPVTISGNEIRDMIFTNGRVNDTPVNWGGAIFCGSQANGSVINNNTIYNIEGLNGASTNVIGIHLNSTASTALINVYSNKIYNLTSNVTRKLGQYSTGCTGIFTQTSGALTPTFNVYNNMIRLGFDRAGGAVTIPVTYIGIRDSIVTTGSASMANYYANTIYIGYSYSGQGIIATTDTVPTFGMCFATSATNVGTRNVKNNLIINNRGNATTGSNHFSVATGGGTAGLSNFNSDNNDFVASGLGGYLGRFANNNIAITLEDIRLNTGGDSHSIEYKPILVNEGLPTPDLHLVQVDYNANENLNFAAILPAPFDVDFDGNDRKVANRTIGADEFLGAVTAINSPVKTSVFATVINDNVIINNVKAGHLIYVYNMGGQQVKQVIALQGQNLIQLKAGIYIIKVDADVIKVVL